MTRVDFQNEGEREVHIGQYGCGGDLMLQPHKVALMLFGPLFEYWLFRSPRFGRPQFGDKAMKRGGQLSKALHKTTGVTGEPKKGSEGQDGGGGLPI